MTKLFNISLMKTIALLICTYLITVLLTQYVVYADKPKIRPAFRIVFENITAPILGRSGQPLTPEELFEIQRK